MKFIDTAKIKVSSGKGGNGIVAWRREKYEPRGGPAGGDGGRGGSVYLEADHNLSTLLDFKYKSIYKAQGGKNGQSKNKYGKSGQDLIIKVPCGTIAKDCHSNEIIADLVFDKQKVLIAEGGKGGRGNTHFATSTRQSPHFCEPGESEIEREIGLELKLIADVGIIGMPNAGKSTLISVISAARPKIADYPFTTLTPNLGIVRKPDGDGIVVADIPGLIQGSSAGHGLGHEFIRHIYRTKVLLQIIDGAGANGIEPLTAYKIVQQELKNYDSSLLKKQQILIVNKIDLLNEDDIKKLKSGFTKKNQSPVFISCATRQNLQELLNNIFQVLDAYKEDAIEVRDFYDPSATDHKTDEFHVYKEKKEYYVEGKRIRNLLEVTDLKNYQSVAYLMKLLQKVGVFKELEKIGAHEGCDVYVEGIKFEYNPEIMILS